METIFKNFSLPLFLWQLINIVAIITIIYFIAKLIKKYK
jgi:hypothetical protein